MYKSGSKVGWGEKIRTFSKVGGGGAQVPPCCSCKRSYPYVKKSFKAQPARIPIDPAILAATGHRFIAQKKEN